MLEISLTLVAKIGESWQAEQPCNYPGYVLEQPNIHPICNPLEYRGREVRGR